MKTLNQIRYFLFATTVLGCFANFAQNEYGLDMVFYSCLFISLIFFTEAFILYSRNKVESKTKAFYLFTEHFLIGFLFIGQFFKHTYILPPGPFIVFGGLLLFILYFIYAVRQLIKESKKGVLMSVMVFLFILATILSVNAMSWKTQHLPGTTYLMNFAFYTAILLIVIGLVKRKYSYNGELITLKQRIMKIPGKMPMMFTYFTIWVVYISLIIFGVAPDFYTLTNPPIFKKMEQQNNPKATIYIDNYYDFL